MLLAKPIMAAMIPRKIQTPPKITTILFMPFGIN
jgi:hypothetical protein